MICGYVISQIIFCEAMHFVLGFCVGSLAYLLIQTTHSHTGLKYLTEDSSIFPSWVVLCVSFSIVAHVLEDYLLNWF